MLDPPGTSAMTVLPDTTCRDRDRHRQHAFRRRRRWSRVITCCRRFCDLFLNFKFANYKNKTQKKMKVINYHRVVEDVQCLQKPSNASRYIKVAIKLAPHFGGQWMTVCIFPVAIGTAKGCQHGSQFSTPLLDSRIFPYFDGHVGRPRCELRPVRRK